MKSKKLLIVLAGLLYASSSQLIYSMEQDSAIPVPSPLPERDHQIQQEQEQITQEEAPVQEAPKEYVISEKLSWSEKLASNESNLNYWLNQNLSQESKTNNNFQTAAAEVLKNKLSAGDYSGFKTVCEKLTAQGIALQKLEVIENTAIEALKKYVASEDWQNIDQIHDALAALDLELDDSAVFNTIINQVVNKKITADNPFAVQEFMEKCEDSKFTFDRATWLAAWKFMKDKKATTFCTMHEKLQNTYNAYEAAKKENQEYFEHEFRSINDELKALESKQKELHIKRGQLVNDRDAKLKEIYNNRDNAISECFTEDAPTYTLCAAVQRAVYPEIHEQKAGDDDNSIVDNDSDNESAPFDNKAIIAKLKPHLQPILNKKFSS